jgi:hypothetical protein
VQTENLDKEGRIMKNFWIVPGKMENWHRSFTAKSIWGVKDTSYNRVHWLALSPNDLLLFYVTGKIRGVMGYGIVRSKFIQTVPFWDEEIRSNQVIWKLCFEFDVEFLLPETQWREAITAVQLPKRAFREPLILKEWAEVEPIILGLNPKATVEVLKGESLPPTPVEAEVITPTHEHIKNLLLEIGKLQGYVANSEFSMGAERLDAVWRRLPESVPTYVFEIQVGGDLYHALGKLKHAYDIWNSRIFLIALQEEFVRVHHLLAGTFHEIKEIVRFISFEKIQSLHQSKRNLYNVERRLGLIP